MPAPNRPTAPIASAAAQRRHTGRLARRWLSATGSLTARLKGLGTVRVIRLRQGHQALRPREQAMLGCPHGHVREVLLLVNDRPAVWARSATSVQAAQGAWRAIHGLGNRPLAELLFSDAAVRRAPLQSAPLRNVGPGARRRARDWQRVHPTEDRPHWIRWSVFERHGQALLVQEAFAPWVLAQQAPPPALTL